MWAGRSALHGEVAVRVLEPEPIGGPRPSQQRLHDLRALEHPALVRVLPSPSSDVLITSLVEGPTLSSVRTARRGLSGPETIGLATALLGGLAALHAQGLAHGDPAPGNVVISTGPDGETQPVLIDLAHDPAWHAGTPGFVAPEVRAGKVAGPAADVWSVATLCVWACAAPERDVVSTPLRAALAMDPSQRPTATELATALSRIAQEPVRVPPASVLAGAALREQAHRAATVVRRRSRGRHRRRRRMPLVIGALSLAAALAAGCWMLVLLLRSDDPPAAAAGPGTDDLAATVVQLITARDEALAAQDATGLAELTVSGSQARAQDEALLAELIGTDTEIRGLSTAVSEVVVREESTDAGTVSVSLQQDSYERARAGTTEVVPAQAQRCVLLRLELRDERWQVSRAQSC